MTRRLWLVTLLILLVGCGRSKELAGVASQPVSAADLSGQTFNLLAKNADESVILLGHLRFDPIQGTAVTGSWDLSQWSGPTTIPGLPATGAFTGSLDRSTLVLKLPLADPATSLGIVSQGFVNGRLSGTLSLLPSLRFTSGFEAIRSDQGPS